MIHRRTAIAVLASPLLLTGCGGGAEATERRTPPTRPAPAATPEVQAAQAPHGRPGLGPLRSAGIPERCGQAVVVTGRGKDSPLCTVVLHRRTGFEGEPREGCFDYVIAIDYNRRPGTLPLDWTRPLGPKRGGGVRPHVDHGGPTHGCVSVAKAHLKELPRTLDPGRHPAVVMGHADWLAA
ncbi:hypothetical protein [Streptomyces puniciscabiei]|uniref:hypothetical protein n=1 Tax=Streptomyces puniciscabiei TaxID=164348 RepID=UPI001153EE97|nr:hypothetical protein [Streptomyces puniciscabiei]